jgi:hypothetical protein
MRHLSAPAAAVLRRFAEDGDLTKIPVNGELRVVNAELTGRHAVSLARQGETLWVILDLARPEALGQLRDLLRTWPMPAVLRMPFVVPPAASAMELVG